MHKALKIIMLGPPGAGKGTYGSLLSNRLNIPHISIGSIIRHIIDKHTRMGNVLEEYTTEGKLVPDQFAIDLVKEYLQKSPSSGYLLDGFPRNYYQLVKLLEFAPPTLCVNLNHPRNIILQKLLGRRVCQYCGKNYNIASVVEGEYNLPPLLPKPDHCSQCFGNPVLVNRSDDSEEAILKRIQINEEESKPILNFFLKNGKLINIEMKKGLNDINKLEQQIIDAVR